MNNFFEKVYEVVSQIPLGKVATYGQIAAILGKPQNGRVVGWAMRGASAKRKLPCHRVVNKSGRLAPTYAFGGKDIQRVLLETEGVTFRENGCINMEKHLWDGKIVEN